MAAFRQGLSQLGWSDGADPIFHNLSFREWRVDEVIE